MRATLHTDGGARGNPGPAGIGYVLVLDGGELLEEGAYIGEATNNQAEYTALLRGMERAYTEKVDHLVCYLDSELLVRQLTGRYRVKDAKLKPLFVQAQELRRRFVSVEFHHIVREKNKHADRLVNAALDARS